MTSQPPAPMPTTDLEGSECNKTIPRYLYRVYAPDSNGHNSATTIASAAASNHDSRVKPSESPPRNIKDLLTAHFLWIYFDRDPFVSWTSSLLYALQYAVRKTRNDKYPKRVSKETEVKLCILDTAALDTDIFSRASDLIQVYNIPAEGKLKHEYHTTEYLLTGKLDIEHHSKTISLSTLREEGLFELLPELDEKESKPKLWHRVNELRGSIAVTLRPICAKEGGLALWIASLFGGAFTMPVMMALLSLRRREVDDEGGLGRVVREFGDPTRDFQLPYASHEFDNVDAPEVANFARLMDAGFREMRKVKAGKGDGSEGLVDKVQGLRIGEDDGVEW